MIGNLEALEVINRQRYNFLKSACMENGGTIADWKITNFLKDDLLSVQDFVDKSGLDISTLSRQVKRAVEKKLISRNKLETDHRRTLFKITEKGRLLKDEVNRQLDIYDQKLFENWSKEELSMFNILINRVLKNALK
ncbi:MarR family winged helix-turn-helix transcriptional regulator [Pediococcus pentosaceus]|jgi:DNA-binding MarR family transcriptional regulator|uniref:MarR family transcriptional regulator n=1 Tax=Pediococcus pentosaceus TaxID=1255 RepID=A0ABD7X7I1_PEDPE|nr:MarR family transcriptional regulator [Pediococcus pentosaceus]MCV3329818.1 MarR family transcriptional regulator [Pediococcus pentosaceus]MDE7510793.1 MarR family transcriptional regulator [Pediococcus pentosaceus]WEA57360.1 MarR family transcriptional regulator [Pediococcus pentosaceus]WKF70238.1 MarR family transcriptional regulator [Pediococcus pentosaceus]WRI50168.1 MarR family transcriptional regulator [Pediococcus pentosaceus]